MLRQALRTALIAAIQEHAPAALVDAYGNDGLSVWFEAVNVEAEPRAQITQWSDCTAVVVLYVVDDIERLIHCLSQTTLKLFHEANGLMAEGAAKFKALKEGPIQGQMYSELRFSLNGTIRG